MTSAPEDNLPQSVPEAAVERAPHAGAGHAAKMNFTDRPPMTAGQMLFLLLTLIASVTFFGYGFACCVFTKNIEFVPEKIDCRSGWHRRSSGHAGSPQSTFCMSPQLTKDWEECQAKAFPEKEKQEQPQKVEKERSEEDAEILDDETDKMDMWDVFAHNPQVTAVVFPTSFIVAAAWFFTLKQYPKAVVYGSIGFGIVCQLLLVFSGLLSPKLQFGFVGSAVFTAIVTFVARHHIDMTCRTASAACKILREKPSVFAACLILKAFWIVTAGLFTWFCISGELTASVKMETFGGKQSSDIEMTYCTFEHSGLNSTPILSNGFVFMTWFFDMSSVLVCSFAMGTYYLHRGDPDAPAYPEFLALQWAFTKSSGAVSESAWVMTFVTFCRQFFEVNKSGAWMCAWPINPLWWLGKLLWWFIEKLVTTLTRFKLIAHGFHGGGLYTEGTGALTIAMLEKHLGKALVAEVIGSQVLPQSAAFLSLALGMGTWVWMDTVENIGLFAGAAGVDPAALLLMAFLMYLVVSRIPQISLLMFVVMTVFRDAFLFVRTKGVAVIFSGFFVAAMTMNIFMFFVNIIFHSIDGLLYAYALEAEYGIVSEKNKEALSMFNDVVSEVKEVSAGQDNYGATESA